ncbi:DUF4127 family protein [Paenibacillus sp. IITD108]|uniref:DUF4127 family protein n=1 Tax=Paenibacillus sp. IITD108 TaxID=3116649 RepID=UPI002F3F9D7B
MTKIVFLPLDERPCSLLFPMHLAACTDLQMVAPHHLLGMKKQPAPVAQLAQWVEREVIGADYLLVSIDMLVHGGIVPSRLHHVTVEECMDRLALLEKVRKNHPHLNIYAFSLIMRTPQYCSAEEEPDYYADYGHLISRYSWLRNKEERNELSQVEQDEFVQVRSSIPSAVLDDFIGRRTINHAINRQAIEYVNDGVIDTLLIPLDDNAQFGFSVSEQRQLRLLAEQYNLMDKVFIHSGADEAGCTLFARAFCDAKQFAPEVFIRYSSTLGPLTVPDLEERSLHEAVKSHLSAAGGYTLDNSQEADAVLAVHTAVHSVMTSDSIHDLQDRHASYFTEINMNEFASAIDGYIRRGKVVGLADAAIINGADHYLLQLLSKRGMLKDVSAYAGWNTIGNTLGTVIAHMIIEAYYKGQPHNEFDRLHRSREFYALRLLEDWGYQAVIRKKLCKEHPVGFDGKKYVDLSTMKEQVDSFVNKEIQQFVESWLTDAVEGKIEVQNVYFPWNRVFEIGLDLQIVR